MNRAAYDVPIVDANRCGKPVSAPVAAVSLAPITTADRRIEYCLALARDNMQPYLTRRGQEFDETRWRNLAPQASFFLIDDVNLTVHQTVGFLSVRDESERPTALHIGDVQLEEQHRNRGVGWATLSQVEGMARSRRLNGLTLNVFRDNPALRLYERFGFQCIETTFDKHKMRKTFARRPTNYF